MNDKKPAIQSKTIVTNCIILFAALAGLWGVDVGVDEQSAIVAGCVAVANVVLRFLTYQGVRLT